MRKQLTLWLSGIFMLLAASLSLAQTDLIYRNGFESLTPGSLIPGTETPTRNSTIAADALPLISTRFTFIGSGTQVFKIELDGTDVTKLAQLSSDRISYTPSAVLTEGNHTVQVTIGTAPTAVVGSWTFKTATPPVISGETPYGAVIVLGSPVQIKADYLDIGSGVNLSGVKIKIDKQDVTSVSSIGIGTIENTANNLEAGEHIVELAVPDMAGNVKTSTWHFFVGSPPIFIDASPAQAELISNNLRPSIGVTVLGKKIQISSIKLYLNNTDQTKNINLLSTQSGVRISYTPRSDLAAGPQQLLFFAKDELNIPGWFQLQFLIDYPIPYRIEFVNPDASTIVKTDNYTSVVKVTSFREINQVKINGLIAMPQNSSLDGERLFTKNVRLNPGENFIEGIVYFPGGELRTPRISVIYDTSPAIKILEPTDWSVFGPTSNITTQDQGPLNLTGKVERSVSISGIASKDIVRVEINQQLATIATDRRNFTFSNFFLHEGTNLVSAVAYDQEGRSGSTNITVYVDYTAPIVTCDSPVEGAVTSASKIDLRGTINDAVSPSFGAISLRATNLANNLTVNAQISDFLYFVVDVPLEVGMNEIKIVGIDERGNERTISRKISRVAAGTNRITITQGDRQQGDILEVLAQPLTISAFDKNGIPLSNLDVNFKVSKGSGFLSKAFGVVFRPDGINPARYLSLKTNAAGEAKVWLTLGVEPGIAGNSVHVWSDEFPEDVNFTATGKRGPATSVIFNGAQGFQYAQTNSQPIEALSVVALDSNFNPVPGAKVLFTIVDGDGYFNASSALKGLLATDRSIIVECDRAGIANVRPSFRSMPGIVTVSAEVNENIVASGRTTEFKIDVQHRGIAETTFNGKVMDHTGKPIAGVRVSIGRTNLSASTNALGLFEFNSGIPIGKIDLFIDGRTVTNNSIEYPSLHFEANIISGRRNQLPNAIYLPPINLSSSQIVGGSNDVTMTIPGFDAFKLIVKANSVTFPDGTHIGPLTVSAINGDRLPMVPPGPAGSFMGVGWTIQPAGTRFDPPIEAQIPNSNGLRPGETSPVFQWDHDLATFVPMGMGTITEVGDVLVTDAGSGISKAGWGGAPAAPPPFPNCGQGNPPAVCRGAVCSLCGTCPSESQPLVRPELTILPPIEFNGLYMEPMKGAFLGYTKVRDSWNNELPPHKVECVRVCRGGRNRWQFQGGLDVVKDGSKGFIDIHISTKRPFGRLQELITRRREYIDATKAHEQIHVNANKKISADYHMKLNTELFDNENQCKTAFIMFETELGKILESNLDKCHQTAEWRGQPRVAPDPETDVENVIGTYDSSTPHCD